MSKGRVMQQMDMPEVQEKLVSVLQPVDREQRTW